jgi:hypothetical protein
VGIQEDKLSPAAAKWNSQFNQFAIFFAAE